MKQKIPLIISSILIFIGLINFDIFIYPTLDYFGKFVMVGALNIVPFWIVKMIFDKFKNNIKSQYIFTIIWGVLSGGVFVLIS
jgi:hypothetical protein